MFIFFFISACLVGILSLSFMPKNLNFLEKFAAIFLFGTLFVTILNLLFYPLIYYSNLFIYPPNILPILLIIPCFQKIKTNCKELFVNCNFKFEIPLLLAFISFSSFIFLKTIWTDFSENNLLIAGKLWSDFGAHIPLIKSFSVGFNFPPQYPLFPGEHIRYHFFADFHFAILEKLGLPLFWGINIFSILSFTSLLILIYSVTQKLFSSQKVATLSIFLFITNSSLAFLSLFKKIPPPESISLTTVGEYLQKIIHNREFLAFGPYDKSYFTAFWNLNVYTNQRHLAFSLALLILFLLHLLHLLNSKHKEFSFYIFWGVIFGLTPLVHSGIFLIYAFSLPLLFMIFPKKNFMEMVALSFLLAAPTLWYFQSTPTTADSALRFQPYYWTYFEKHTVFNFFKFWFFNLGLTPFLLLFGLIKSQRNKRLLFGFSLTPFLIGNFLSFSPDLNTNHKFFNFCLIIFNIYSAYAIFYLCQKIRIKLLKFIAAIVLIIILSISGVLDFFPAVNDTFFKLPDEKQIEDIRWIEKNTPRDAIFANSYYLYYPASLAGRRIVLGWPYFSWSAGYNTDLRNNELKAIYTINEKNKTCSVLNNLHVSYVSISTEIKDESSNFDLDFWKQTFPLIYQNEQSGFYIFKTDCR